MSDGSVQVFVHWEEVVNGLQATCRLKGRDDHTTILPVDVTATAIDANILGHYGLTSRNACCEHDGHVPASLRGMPPAKPAADHHPV